MIEKILHKEQTNLEKDIVFRSVSNEMTLEEFKYLFSQVYNSGISYACSSRATSGRKAVDICNSQGVNSEKAYDELEKLYGRLWYYTGD